MAAMVSGRMSGTSPERTRRFSGTVSSDWAKIRLYHLKRMAGPQLFSLKDKLYAGGSDSGADAFCFVANNAVDMVGGNNLFRSSNDVEQKSASTDLVEDLGTLTPEPRAFTGSHDGDGEA